MDVDLLRPGTVPISPDTVLWFEFLLNPSLLEKHLSKPLPDPSPTDLMIKFMGLNTDPKDNDVKIIDVESNDSKSSVTKKWSYKSIALKILSLKVAAYLKWDLDILETKLPLPMQLTLFQDLFYITADVVIEIPTLPEFSLTSVSEQLLFAIVLYHRWHIRAIIHRALYNKQTKQQFIHIPGIQESTYVPPALVDDIIRKLEAHIPHSLNVLNAVLESNDFKPKVPSLNTFQMLNEDTTEIKQNWENMHAITLEEFKCQIHYDLAAFHLLREEYKSARHHVSGAQELFKGLQAIDSLLYCTVKKNYLDGYCLATEVPVEGHKQSLTQQLHASVKDQYTNILEILQADNIAREIPQVYRDNLELDIQGGLVNRKIIVARDLLLRIQCLNLIRKILDGDVIHGNYIVEIKSADEKGLDVLCWAFDHVLEKSNETDKRRIARYLHYLVLMGDMNQLAERILDNPIYKELFNAEEICEIQQHATTNEVELPALLLNDDWGVSLVTYTQSPKFEVFELERRLILSYDAHEIREILIRLDGSNPMNPLWRVNSRWVLPIPLQSVIMSVPRGFRQDYSYVLLAKSRELVIAKDFTGAKELLNALEQEVQQQPVGSPSLTYKLNKLFSWESMLVDIWHYMNIWPSSNEFLGDVKALIEKCKQCLASIQSSDQIVPRQEIIEYCTAFLLNTSEWEYLATLDKRWSHCEFSAAISLVCQDVVKFMGSRKFPREAWDIILNVFGTSRDQPQKRGSSGNASGSAARDVIASTVATLSRLREPTVLTVVISLLARVHNVLRDESSFELYAQYLTLWPAAIPNPNSYSIKSITESLFQLLTQALKYYPTNIPWLRVMGDLNFVLGYYESAMKFYLEAIMVASDLFSQPVPRSHIDDLVYRRMMKSCAHLQCYTQAAVLCQFLEEVDYSLAFKMAASDQKSSTSADAMDAYYHCIWDTTILEYLIHLHTKRGEHHRKQLAIKIIGLLELNSNNNEEIQREAANTRKAKFFRALAKQYVY